MENKSGLRIVFFGTPAFALPSLHMLLEEGYQVVGVVTQPDRPKGRGHKLLPPPVKVAAEEAGIPAYQYQKVSREGLETLSSLGANLFITVAFGQILSRELLALPELGCINVHGSLLPKYRGAAPIEWAILLGENKTGISTMYTVYELDAGDILEQDEVEIGPEETGGELRERLSYLGAETLKRTLEKLLAGALTRKPQLEEEATYYPMFSRDFGEVNFLEPCLEIQRKVRALNPAPMAYTRFGGDKIKLFSVRMVDAQMEKEPGTILLANEKDGLVVQAKDGRLEICTLQFPGGKAMSAKDFLRGRGKGLFWEKESRFGG